MVINRDYVSEKNTYKGQNKPKYIVIHETDNSRKGANAKTHAYAQAAGHLDMSVHYYSGSDGVYQAAEHSDGTFSIGREYSNSHPVMDATNKNSINIEICVNEDGNYEIARENAIALVKHLMMITDIPAGRVIRHFDAKGKYCPRKMMDEPALWSDFKAKIGQKTETIQTEPKEMETWYRVGTGWISGICQGQIGAFLKKENAIAACKAGYRVYDAEGKVIYTGAESESEKNISGDIVVKNIQIWCNLYARTGLVTDGVFGVKTKMALCKALQHYLNDTYGSGLVEDGIFGNKTKAACVVISGKSSLVYIAQAMFYGMGYDMGHSVNNNDLDGKYGEGTENIVKKFQKEKNLKQDGACGPATFYQMFNS